VYDVHRLACMMIEQSSQCISYDDYYLHEHGWVMVYTALLGTRMVTAAR